jgi:hypothetical protein
LRRSQYIEETQIQTHNFLYNERSIINKKSIQAGCQWLMPVILGTQEAEIKGIRGSRPTQGKKFRRPHVKQ